MWCFENVSNHMTFLLLQLQCIVVVFFFMKEFIFCVFLWNIGLEMYWWILVNLAETNLYYFTVTFIERFYFMCVFSLGEFTVQLRSDSHKCKIKFVYVIRELYTTSNHFFMLYSLVTAFQLNPWEEFVYIGNCIIFRDIFMKKIPRTVYVKEN